jgi:hypothetical protein
MPDIDNRVSRLEFRADAQDREISALHSTQAVFSDSLQAIQKTLLQIKYALYGAAGMYLLSTLGLKETILQFIK